MSKKPHFIFLGGFLGAGKTTAVSRLARYLMEQGLRAGLITNDQGRSLVDTATLQNCERPTEEIDGGCFCCRFDALIGSAQRLCHTEQLDVLIAEAVGSCADLAATVTYPLRQLHGQSYTVAPLSILVDPVQASQMLGADPNGTFSADVRYLYRKQLDEADLIIINKCESVCEDLLEELRTTLMKRVPTAELLMVSCRNAADLEPWFRRLVFGRQKPRTVMDLDYGQYARGEACLAWLNASVLIQADVKVDPDGLLLRLAGEMQRRFDAADAQIAHLKLSLQPLDADAVGAAVVNVVRRDLSPESSWRLDREIGCGRVLVNARAEVAPEMLESIVLESLSVVEKADQSLEIRLERVECFRPSPPVPTHRVEWNARLVNEEI